MLDISNMNLSIMSSVLDMVQQVGRHTTVIQKNLNSLFAITPAQAKLILYSTRKN